MNFTLSLRILLALSMLMSMPFSHAYSTVDDALAFAYEAADPYVKEGFTVREEAWGGDLEVGGQKGIRHQLFKGNEYWFWAATSVDGAQISVHIYDEEGKLAEADFFQKGRFSGARIVPKKTGTYYLLVRVEKSAEERTTWALVYGFR